MTQRPIDIVIVGLSLSSSWGNGHATTYRALIRGLQRLGHRVLFLERDVPWYAANRDLPDPDFCDLRLYADLTELAERHRGAIADADAVIFGSYVPEGVAALDIVLEAARGPVAFYDIDTPVTLAKLSRGDEEYLARRQIPAVDLYLSFTGGPLLQRLTGDFGARRSMALYCAVDETRYRPTGDAPVWDLGYLGTYSDDRQPTLERLLIEPARRLPHRRFVVAGPQYPDAIAWPPNVDRIDHLPPSEHAAFYGRQRHTLNVTRADMIAAGWSPSVRLFEAAACGTPIVSDVWDGLTDLLPDGEAIVLALDAADVVAVIEAGDDDARRARAERARAIVLGEHTGTARAAQLVEALSALRQAHSNLAKVG
ncbi:spore maturation protein CgeB [Constrictibacter sp. MBR-5]|jgi:spore maturation protein CgeB|uniref:CgeB family protein n=1 Tax=Constrictibacter sp. MBR-5 TaxID=3156467 RepID=UPI003395DA55